jgi:outer membrane murein-binding lipoprotein Lpp
MNCLSAHLSKYLTSLLLAAAVGTGLLLAGCDSGGSGGGGTMTVNLTDAPGDVQQAEVTIERVAAVSADNSSEGGAREGGVDVLSDSSFTTDLTRLQDGVTELLGEVQVPPGTYSQIRLVTADTADVLYETDSGGTASATLKQPSASETGIKINFDPVDLNSESDRAEVTLDFSVQESFVEAGQTGTYIFKPVVDAEAVVVNGDTTSTGGGA